MESKRVEINDTGSTNKIYTVGNSKANVQHEDIGDNSVNGATDNIRYIDEDSESKEHEEYEEEDETESSIAETETHINLTNSNEDFTRTECLWIYFSLIIAIVFSVLDVGTDVLLMCQYLLGGQYLYGTLTMIFVWGPAVHNTYRLCLICGTKSTWLYKQLANNNWLLIILTIIPITSAVVALNNLILFYKKKTNKTEHKTKTNNLLDLQMFESFLEAAPQLTLQLYVILNNLEQAIQDTSYLNILRWISMGLSMLTIARVAYSFAIRDLHSIGVKEAVTGIISTLLLVGSRLVVMSMGLTASPSVTGCCLLIHWSIYAISEYLWFREKQSIVTRSLLNSAVYATMRLFHYNWYSRNSIIFYKLRRRTYIYTVYTSQCVVFTVLWCVYSSTPGSFIWYYIVPAVGVLLYILYIQVMFIYIHVDKKWLYKHNKDIEQNINKK